MSYIWAGRSAQISPQTRRTRGVFASHHHVGNIQYNWTSVYNFYSMCSAGRLVVGRQVYSTCNSEPSHPQQPIRKTDAKSPAPQGTAPIQSASQTSEGVHNGCAHTQASRWASAPEPIPSALYRVSYKYQVQYMHALGTVRRMPTRNRNEYGAKRGKIT